MPRHGQDDPGLPAPLGRDGATAPSRIPTTSTTLAASTVGGPSSPRSSRAVTIMLFGRLEAAGAPRWADGAVGEPRWAEWGVSRCVVSGPTPSVVPCSLERMAVHVCVLAAC